MFTLHFAILYVLQPHLMFWDPTLHFAAIYILQLYIVPPYFTFCSTLHFATLHCATLLYVLQHFTFCGPTRSLFSVFFFYFTATYHNRLWFSICLLLTQRDIIIPFLFVASNSAISLQNQNPTNIVTHKLIVCNFYFAMLSLILWY